MFISFSSDDLIIYVKANLIKLLESFFDFCVKKIQYYQSIIQQFFLISLKSLNHGNHHETIFKAPIKTKPNPKFKTQSIFFQLTKKTN